MSDFFQIISNSTALSLSAMFLTWLWSIKKNYYSAVDVVWSYGFGAVALLIFLNTNLRHLNTLVLSAMFFFWSLRLGTHLFLRLKAHFPQEDGRYTQLKKDWKNRLHLSFLIFFLVQGLSVVFLSLPLYFVAISEDQKPGILQAIALGLWIIALLGETIADRQLKGFKNNPKNKGKTCQIGLWRYSRHPNYFFEWLIWVSYFLFASGSPWGWVSVVCPMLMLYFLFKVTGIPATEAQSLRSRGDEYREYQRTTSVFVPWWRKN